MFVFGLLVGALAGFVLGAITASGQLPATACEQLGHRWVLGSRGTARCERCGEGKGL